MIVCFVFSTVQHDNTGISPVERAISLVTYIIKMVTQTDRIGVPDFVIPPHKESRDTISVHSFGQFTDKGSCLIMTCRVVYTITVENNKIIVNILNLPAQSPEGMGMLMQVIEHNSSKRIRTGYRQSKFTESRTGSISENFLICLIKQHFL